MEITYRKLMKEWEIDLDSPILDPAFVAKAKDFEARLSKKSLTDEEIKAIDEELVKLFKEHDLKEEDSEELKKEKRKNRILEAREKIAGAGTVDAIRALEQEYADVIDALGQFIEKRIEKLTKAAGEEEKKQFTEQGKEEIAGADYGLLQGLLEKYGGYKELVTLIEKRLEEEKPAPAPPTLREKIQAAKKRQWTYDELREIGIKPTGENMEIEGIFFERQYLFKVYHITKVDGKKV